VGVEDWSLSDRFLHKMGHTVQHFSLPEKKEMIDQLGAEYVNAQT